MGPLYRRRRISKKSAPFFLIPIWLLAFGLMLGSAVQKSATVDESAHIQRGLAYLRYGATQFRLGNPVTGDALAAAPALLEPNLVLPTDHPAWAAGDWSVAANVFMWESGLNSHRILFLSRLTGMWFALLLGGLVFRWGQALAGPGAGLLAAALVLLDPNVIAHARLVTNDVPAAFAFCLTFYGFWRYAAASGRGHGRRPGSTSNSILVAGFGLGLGAAIKFTTLIAVPVLALLAFGLAWRRRRWQPLVALVTLGLTAWVVLWAANGFAWRPLPGGSFWEELNWQRQYVGGTHGVFLNGIVSSEGWWYYFIYAFLIKMPLPTLLLLAVATTSALRRRSGSALTYLFVLVPALLFFLSAQITALNIGFRYLLNALPLLALFCAYELKRPVFPASRLRQWLPPLSALFLGMGSTLIWPNYISHFNLLAGGQGNGWRLLSDSNVDWGQDLVALNNWQEATGQYLYLSYFGTAAPSAYGLDFSALPTWAPAPEQTPPDRQAFYPPEPAPGFYAISVSNLHGAVLGDRPDTFDYFRQLEPIFRAGNSIFVYEVSATGPPVNVAFAGLTPADLPLEAFVTLGSNDLQIRWYESTNSAILTPTGMWRAGTAAAAAADAFPFVRAPEISYLWDEWGISHIAPAAQLALPILAPFKYADLSDVLDPTLVDGRLSLRTLWQVTAPADRQLRIFVHALDADDSIIGQSDVLTVDSHAWQAGDWFWQAHDFSVSSAPRALRLGLYDPATGTRLGEPWLRPWP